MPQTNPLEDRWQWLRTTAMISGFMVAMVGSITLFGQRKHSHDFIFESLGAFPWATALSLIGSLFFLWGCWKLPRRATEGPIMAIILLILTAAGIVVGTVRLDWSMAGTEIVLSLMGQFLTMAILVASAIHSARKKRDGLR